MKTFLHLVRRELLDYRLFFVAALAFGLLPYALAPLAAAGPGELPLLRAEIAKFVVLGFFVLTSCMLGARWLIAGFASGQRGFELTRPISAWQLCASKLSANLLLIFGGTWLASLPTFMTAFSFDRAALDASLYQYLTNDRLTTWTHYRYLADYGPFGWGLSWNAFVVAAVAAAALALLALAQTISLVIAGRSARSLADLAALLAFFGLLALAAERLRLYGAVGIGLCWLLPLALLVGGLGIFSAWRAFGAGSLLGEAHRRHSLAMSSGLVLLGALTVGAAQLATRPSLERLESFSLVVPNADLSRWIVSGTQDWRGLEPAFAVDRESGKATYLMPRRDILGMPFFSESGDRVFNYHSGSSVSLQIRPLADLALTEIPLALHEIELDGMAVDPGRTFLVAVSTTGELSAQRLNEPGRPAFRLKDPELSGKPTVVVHRQGSRFDLLVYSANGAMKPESRIWTVRQFAFDAATGELRPLESRTFPQGFWPPGGNGSNWWQVALPLMDAGFPFSQLAASRRLVALAGGRGAMQLEGANDAGGETADWRIFDAQGETLGTFQIAKGAVPVGEIRPGLLLVGTSPIAGVPHHLSSWIWWMQENPERFRTLVVEVPSGRILRQLQGFAPVKYPGAGDRVWLIDQNGEPYDLAAADAEPQRMLPFRPLAAGS